jgi:hypothetical protein
MLMQNIKFIIFGQEIHTSILFKSIARPKLEGVRHAPSPGTTRESRARFSRARSLPRLGHPGLGSSRARSFPVPGIPGTIIHIVSVGIITDVQLTLMSMNVPILH